MTFPFLLSLALASSVQAAAPPAARSELEALSVGELIARLPHVGEDSTYDRTAKRLDYPPVVVEFMRRLRDGATLSDRDWQDALLRTGVIRVHAKWPVTEPLALSFRRPSWLPNTEIRLQPAQAGWPAAAADRAISTTCGTCAAGSERRALYQELGNLELGAHELGFRAEIVTNSPPSFATSPPLLPAGTRWNGPLVLAVEVVPTIDDALPPVSDAAVDRAVRASLGCAFADWADGRTAILVLDPDFSVHPALATIALSLQIDVMNGEQVVVSKSLRASDYDRYELGNSVSKAAKKSIAFTPVSDIPSGAETDVALRSGWHLRVKGTSEGVLRNWSATQRFGGSFDVPLDELIRSEAERAGPKGRGPWGWMPGPR